MLSSALAHEIATLHPKQRDAVLAAGNVLVLAGPGAGKTRTLVARIGYLLSDVVPPRRGVAAITYTDAAATEVTARLRQLGLRPGRRLASRTLHSFCLHHVLIPYGALSHDALAADYRVLDEENANDLWERCANDARIPFGNVKELTATFTRIRRMRAAGEGLDTFPREYLRAVNLFESELWSNNALDFDEMVFRSLDVVRRSTVARTMLVARFPHLIVDEYQDLGPALHALVLEFLACGITVSAVGDPDQTLYEFLGADPRYLHELGARRDFDTIRLTLNYRSGRALVAASKAALGTDRGYEADPNREGGPGAVTVVRVPGDLDAHANETVAIVQRLADRDVRYEDIAVIYPSQGALHSLIGEALTRASVPFDKERARRVPDSPIMDLVSACAARRLSGPLPGVPGSELRTASGRAPAATRDLVRTWQTVQQELATSVTNEREREAGRRLVDVLDGPNREAPSDDCDTFLAGLSAVLELPRLAAQSRDARDAHAIAALSRAVRSGLSMAELAGGRAPGRVVVTTYHSAKGREFAAVILPGLIDGLMPFHRQGEIPPPTRLATDRRQFYVGFTRAKDNVYLLSGTYFTWYGRIRRERPSRFVDDVEAALA